MDEDCLFIALISLMVGMMIILLILAPDVNINQVTANDICFQLTGNESAVASSQGGKLVCEIPSFDSTHNIIVRESGGEE